MMKSRMLPLAAATVAFGLAFAPAAFADEMGKGMTKDKMENSSMSKSHDSTKTNGMTKTDSKMSTDKMSNGMKN